MKRFGWALFFVVIAYFIFVIRQDIIDNLELRKEERSVAVNYDKEKKLSEELQNKLKLLTKDSYIEDLARTRLGYVKSGEKAFKVIRPEK